MKKKVKLIAILMAAVFALSACGGSQAGSTAEESKTEAASEAAGSEAATEESSADTQAPEAGVEGTSDETLTLAFNTEPNGLDFQNVSFHSAESTFGCFIFDTLVRWNNYTKEVEPCVAESWEQIDELTTRFKLREDVYSHDGYQIKANDIVELLKVVCECPALGSYNRNFDIEKCAAVDDFTVDIVTLKPDPMLLKNLTMNIFSVVSAEGIEAAGGREAIARNPVSATGPYKFVEWVSGDHITVERNENYWGEKPYYAKVVLRVIPDDSSRLLALQSNDVQAINKVLPSQLATIPEGGDVEILRFSDEYQMMVLVFNCREEGPLSDYRVRRALSLAYNRQAATQIVMNGEAEPATGYFPSTASAFVAPSEEISTYTYDLDAAKELMKEAGYENGFEMTMICMENKLYSDNAEFAQAAWKDLGVTVNVEISDGPSFWKKLNGGEYDAYSIMNSGVNFQKFVTYSPVLDYAGGANAAYKEASEDFANAITEVETVFEDDPRFMELETLIQNEINEKVPAVACMNGVILHAARTGLTGYSLGVMGDPDYSRLRPAE